MAKYTLTVRRLGLTAIVAPLVSLSNIILLPILTKTLPIADYGAWALVMTTVGLLPMLATLGLPYAMTRFLAASTDKRDIREAFYSMGLVVFLTSLAVSGLLFLFLPQLTVSWFHNNSTIALLLLLNVLIACLAAYVLQYFVTFQQIKRYSILSLFNAYLNTALVAYFVLSGRGLQGAMISLLIQQLVVFSVMMYLIVAQIGVAIPRLKDTRQHLAFGLPLVPGSLANWITTSSDRYLIAFFLGAAAVGYYSPGYTTGATLLMFSASFATLLPAVLSKHYDTNSIDDVRTIMSYSLKYYAGAVIPSVFVVSVLSKPLLLVLSTPQIAANGYLVTPFVAAGTALLGTCNVIGMVIILRKKTVVLGTIWVLAATLNFGLNLVLIPYLGLIGAALTTFLAFLLAFVLFTLYALRQFKFDMNAGFMVKSVCGSSIIAFFLLLWNPTGLFSILSSIVFAAVFYLIILLALRGITIQEIKLIYRIYTGSHE